jgi:excisionase family DNA binding protein
MSKQTYQTGFVYTVAEAASLAGVTEQSIYLALWSKRLKAKKIRNVWQIDGDSLREYIEGTEN